MDDDRATLLSLPQTPDAIELRHLRAFVAVAEELNFGRAASRLYLSQPALSRQIRALERLVGPDLLRRSTHRVELTLAGEALLDRARRLLRDLDQAVTATRSIGGELAERIDRLWQPVERLAVGDGNLQELRSACETLHAQFPVPTEVDVQPVNAGGVPALVLVPQPRPPVMTLFLHGGGYATGSAFGYRHLGAALAGAAESGVLLAEYRLAPEHPYPAAVDDARTAYLWLLDSVADPQQVSVVGDSSGGGLVVSLLISLVQQGVPLPGRAVLLCPWLDLSCTIQKPQKDPQALATLAQARRWAAAYLGDHSGDDPVLKPLDADLGGLPPLLVQAGTGDALLEDAHRFTDRARSYGVDARLELYPVATHDFQLFWSFLPEAAQALEQAGRFVREGREQLARGDVLAQPGGTKPLGRPKP